MGTVAALTRQQQRTLAEAVEGYLAARDLLAETQRTYAGTFERFLADLGGDRPLGEVDAEEVAESLTGQWGQAQPTTYNRHRAALSSLWGWAVRQGWTPTNPVGRIERRRQRRSARQERRS